MNHLFPAGKPVTGNQLIGRDNLIAQIIQWLEYGESVVVIAPRRFGKTSLVLEILERMKQNHFTTYIDFFSTPNQHSLAEQITEKVLSNKKLDIAFYNFRQNIGELIKNIEFKQVVEEFEFILNFSDRTNQKLSQLAHSLDFIDSFSKKNKKKMICGFDEFGDLNKLNGHSIVKLFRSKIQMQKNVSYLFTGSYESVMNQLFFESNAPFYRFARIVQLPPIDEQIFHKHLKKQFKTIGITFEKDSISKLLSFTGGHPYYTQLLSQQIEISGKKKISSGHIDEIIETVMWLEINYLEKLWENITAKKGVATVLTIMAKNKSPYKETMSPRLNIPRILRDLKEKGIIERKNNLYTFLDPMFRYWIGNHNSAFQ